MYEAGAKKSESKDKRGSIHDMTAALERKLDTETSRQHC